MRLKGELVLLVIDRGKSRGNGLIPHRDLKLVVASEQGRELLLHHCDVTAGFAEAIADRLLKLGVAVEDYPKTDSQRQEG